MEKCILRNVESNQIGLFRIVYEKGAEQKKMKINPRTCTIQREHCHHDDSLVNFRS